MSLEHPKEFHTPGWHYEARTPIVDGKYCDRETGEARVASNHNEYQGPPAVDIIVMSIHADTKNCVYRAARAFPLETLLVQVVKVIADEKLEIDSLNATPYAIRVILAHELTNDGFTDVAVKMANGVWDQTE